MLICFDMNHAKQYYFIILFCICGINLYAQKTGYFNNELKPLKVGDRIPASIFEKSVTILNYKTKTPKLSEFKNKLIILEFWNTYCGACISAFPKMESLQNELKDKLQILLVTSERESRISDFFKTREHALKIITRLPTIVNDSLLQQLFKHESFPHYVWIDEDRNVVSVTDGYEVTVKNVKAILNNEKIRMRQKTDYQVPYDIGKPLFVYNNGGSGEQLLYHSVVTKFIDGLPFIISAISYDSSEGYSIRVFNQSIRRLYQIAYEQGDGKTEVGIHNNRTILNVDDTLKYVGYLKGVVSYPDLYCYELIARRSSYQELKQMMKKDLERYFGLNAHIEKRLMKCLVLTSYDTTLISSKDLVNYPGGGEFNQFIIKLRNIPFFRVIKQISYNYLTQFPFLDETGIKGNVDMDIAADLTNWRAFSESLKKYKLELSLQERTVDVLVISEKGKKAN